MKLERVTLRDVPLKDRRRAARNLCREEPDPIEQLLIMLAAEKPSARVYYIPERKAA